jgi:thiamine biosynthesis lipoprotein
MRRVEQVWGTAIGIDVRDPIAGLDAAVDGCFTWFTRVDDLFSTWRDDTEIMHIGRGELDIDNASAEVRAVLALGEQMRLETGGAFDVRAGTNAKVPPRPGLAPLDPSGIVKGWAVDLAADMLTAAGASCFTINAGGDVAVRGRPDHSSEGWRVGIQHPWERDRVAAVLVVDHGGIATSGRYERGDHVLDPRTGLPALGVASATVVGPDLAVADAYATAAVVLGERDGARWLATRAGYEAMVITDDRDVWSTPGFDRYRVESNRLG